MVYSAVPEGSMPEKHLYENQYNELWLYVVSFKYSSSFDSETITAGLASVGRDPPQTPHLVMVPRESYKKPEIPRVQIPIWGG